MVSPEVLGKRLKFFRERAGMSQLQLENEIGASSGQISRIEKGIVNPTKETVIEIASSLKLMEKEIAYLIGNIVFPADDKEIEKIKAEIKPYFSNKKVLAYLLDDRNRAIDLSEGFLSFLKWDEGMKQKIVNRTYIEIILDPAFGIKKLLSEKEYPVTVESMLSRFYFEMGFMQDDEFYKNTVKAIEAEPIANKIWKKILANPPKFFSTLNSRTVVFKLFGFNVPLIYSIEPMSSNNRFELIEYTPTNKFVRLLSKIVPA